MKLNDICLLWKRDGIILITGILVVMARSCAARSKPGVTAQQSTSTVLNPSVMLASQVVKSQPHTIGMADISLMPSFSETHSAHTLTSTVTSRPQGTSGLIVSYASKYLTSHNTDLFSNSLQSDTSVIVNSNLKQSHAGYVNSTLDTHFIVATSVHIQSSLSAMSVYSQTSLTSVQITPSKSNKPVDNFATDVSVNSPFLSNLPLNKSSMSRTNAASSTKLSSSSSVDLKISHPTPSQLSSVLQTSHFPPGLHASNFHGSSSSTSPPALKHSTLMATTVSQSQGVTVFMTKNTPTISTTPNISMVIKPPPLQTVTPSMVTSVPALCKTGSCCTFGLSQLPPHLAFAESKPKGFVLAEIRNVVDVMFSVKLTQPPQLSALLKDSFNITTSKNGYSLVLNQEIDLEELYDVTDGKVDVHSLQLQITCSENSSFIVPPRMINITVDDVDDSMPVFSYTDSGSNDCVVPVYRADTSEDYLGELSLRPGRIKAMDGDVTTKHNISYKVLHSEPADYHVYFNLDTENGTVHKTRSMNSSDPSKYVIFVQAVEDSPQQKSRVAVLSIVVVAPSDPFTNPNQVNPTARLVLQIVCTLVLMGFICGFVVIIHHRYTVSRAKVDSWQKDEERDVKLPKLAVYHSSSSSLNSAIPGVPSISSPSQVVVSRSNTLESEYRLSESQKTRRLIVKKPLDTKSRPGWNAPTPRPKRTRYNPFSVYQRTRAT